jgi:hypothetical protein
MSQKLVNIMSLITQLRIFKMNKKENNKKTYLGGILN